MSDIRIIDNFFSPSEQIYRRLRIYLPDDYETAYRRFPVAYFFDGQNIFSDPRSQFYDTWCVNRALDALRDEIGSWIVVGIDHLPDRFGEYTPWRFMSAGLEEPCGARTAEVVAHHIKPFVDFHFKTVPDARHTAIAGSSLGGLMALYTARTFPHIFGRVGAFSPTVMWSDFRTFAHWDRCSGQWSKIYLDVGGNERLTVAGVYMDYPPMVMAFHRHLKAIGYQDHEVRFVFDPEASHSESAWASRFPDAARFFLEKI